MRLDPHVVAGGLGGPLPMRGLDAPRIVEALPCLRPPGAAAPERPVESGVDPLACGGRWQVNGGGGAVGPGERRGRQAGLPNRFGDFPLRFGPENGVDAGAASGPSRGVPAGLFALS